jgi:replicative DNA helicase
MNNLEAIRPNNFNIEAERSVIGGLLLDPERFLEVDTILKQGDFYRHDHQLIYGAIRELTNNRVTPDIISTTEHLTNAGHGDDVGGIAYIGDMIKHTPSAVNIKNYAQIVKEKSKNRAILAALSDCMEIATNSSDKPEETLSKINARFLELDLDNGSASEMKTTDVLIQQVVDKIESYVELQGAIPGISTGFENLDELTMGMQNGDLVVVAGRPSMGKSAFGMSLSSAAARKSKRPVFIFSLEMIDTSLMMREVASLGGINLNDIKRGNMSDQDYDSLMAAFKILKEGNNLNICDKSSLTVEDVVSITRNTAMKQGKPQMIMVDYLQFMTYSGNKDREDQEIQHMTKSLKSLAKEMECPVILLSQLNRGLENRQDKRPIMADLKGSGAIEQDADLIMFLYRDEVYNKETTQIGITEIIIGKQREGELGTAYLKFDGSKMKYSEVSSGYNNW